MSAAPPLLFAAAARHAFLRHAAMLMLILCAYARCHEARRDTRYASSASAPFIFDAASH